MLLRPHIPVALPFRCLLLGLICLYGQAANTATSGPDRQVFNSDSPQMLLAIGTLSVPGYEFVDGERRHREENCTATLVSPSTILTAWHCLEYYRDLSREPLFRLPNVPDQPPMVARRISDGGGMDADWALLRLHRPVRGVKPLPVIRYFYSDDAEKVLVAGFARDAGLGAGGSKLTWQAGCKLVANEWYRIGTSCVTYKGASGGPVFAGGNIIGVISAGDSADITYFAPSSYFIGNLRAFAE